MRPSSVGLSKSAVYSQFQREIRGWGIAIASAGAFLRSPQVLVLRLFSAKNCWMTDGTREAKSLRSRCSHTNLSPKPSGRAKSLRAAGGGTDDVRTKRVGVTCAAQEARRRPTERAGEPQNARE